MLLRDLFFHNPVVYFKILFLSPVNFDPLYYQYFNFNEISYSNFENTSEFLVAKIASLIMLVSGKNYLNVSLITSSLNFLASWSFFSLLREKFKVPDLIIIPFIIWPTLLFWASGINKEVIYLPCLYLIFRFLILIDFGIKQIIIFLTSLFFLAILKPFVFVVLVLSLLLTYFINRINGIGRLVKFVAVLLALFLIFFYSFTDYLNYIILFQLAQENATAISGGTGYVLQNDLSSISGFILLVFDAFLVSNYRPFLTEIQNGITLLLSLESILLLMLSVFVLFKMKYLKSIFLQHKLLFIFVLSYLVLLSVIFGAISFNYGTLMRFKIIITPLFFSFLFFIIYKLRLPNV